MMQNILAVIAQSQQEAPTAPADLVSALNPPGWWHFFLSHHQNLGGDQMQSLHDLFEKKHGKKSWYDNQMLKKSAEGVYSLLSQTVFTYSAFCTHTDFRKSNALVLPTQAQDSP